LPDCRLHFAGSRHRQHASGELVLASDPSTEDASGGSQPAFICALERAKLIAQPTNLPGRPVRCNRGGGSDFRRHRLSLLLRLDSGAVAGDMICIFSHLPLMRAPVPGTAVGAGFAVRVPPLQSKRDWASRWAMAFASIAVSGRPTLAPRTHGRLALGLG